MSEGEKRAHRRAVVRHTVRVTLPGGHELDGTVENLGQLGALITTADLEGHLDVGERITMAIDVAGASRVEVQGEVLRLEQEFAEGEVRRTFAVRFDDAIEA